jgi:hypothetical protein
VRPVWFYCTPASPGLNGRRMFEYQLAATCREFPWACWPTKGDEDARGARTLACRVHTPVNARMFSEQRSSQERRAIPDGNVFGGRKLAFTPPWRSVFPRNCLFRFAFAIHSCLRKLSGECDHGTQECATGRYHDCRSFCIRGNASFRSGLSFAGTSYYGFQICFAHPVQVQ